MAGLRTVQYVEYYGLTIINNYVMKFKKIAANLQ